MLIFFIFLFNTIDSIRIGSISNTTYSASIVDQTYFNMSCQECTCIALNNSAVGWNCMRNNRTCQLIKNYTSADVGFIPINNSTFSFQQIPSRLSTTINPTTSVTTMGMFAYISTSKSFEFVIFLNSIE